jgi:hypothetical protein
MRRPSDSYRRWIEHYDLGPEKEKELIREGVKIFQSLSPEVSIQFETFYIEEWLRATRGKRQSVAIMGDHLPRQGHWWPTCIEKRACRT